MRGENVTPGGRLVRTYVSSSWLRGNTPFEKRVEYDLECIERWSLGLDLKIIALTVARVLFERNAY